MKHLITYIQESLFDKDIIEKDPVKLDPTDLKTRDEIVLYAQVLCARNGWEFEEIESGWGESYSQAFRIKYNKHLSLVVDFFNKAEFIYNWEEDENVFYGINSTIERRDVDNWDEMFDPKQYIRYKTRTLLSSPKKREKHPKMLRCVNKIKELY